MASNEMENSEETMFFKKKEEDDSIGFVEFGKIAATYRLPAGKVQEKEFKKLRRRMKNKISAQESRRRKKEYIDNLEQNARVKDEEIERLNVKIDQLQERVRSLVDEMFQMKQLTLNESQASIVSKHLQQTKSVTRATQTGVCLQCYFVENSKSRHNDSTPIQGYNHPPYNFPGEEKSLTSQRKNVHSPGSHEPDVHRPGNYELYNNNPGSCRPDRHRSNGHQDMIDSSREIRRADKHIMIIPNKMPEFSVLRNSGNDFSPLSANQATAGVEQRLKSLDQKSRIVNMVIEDKERLSQRYATHNGTNDRDFLHSMASKSRSTYTVPQHKDYPTGEMKSHKFVGNSKAFDIPSMSHMPVRSCLPADGRQQTFKDGNVASALYALGKHNDAAAFISLPLAERGTDDAINGKRRPYSATSDSCVSDDKPSNGGRKRFFSYPGDILSMNDTRKRRKMENETRDMASKRYENIKGSFNDLRSTGHRSFDLQKQSSPNKSFLSKEEIYFDQELRGFSPAEEKLLNSRPNHAMAFSTTYTPYLKALETTVIQTAPKANNQHGSDISSPSSAIHRKESSSVPTAGLRMREIFFHKPGRSASCSDIFKPQCGKSYCSLNKDPSSGASSENTDWQHSRKQTRAQESNVNGCAGQNIGGSNVSKDLHQKSGSRFVRNFHDSHPSVNVEYAMKPIVGPPFYLKTTHQDTNWH